MKKLLWLLPILASCGQNTDEQPAVRQAAVQPTVVASPVLSAKPSIAFASGDRTTSGPHDTLHVGQGLVLRLEPGSKSDFTKAASSQLPYSEARIIRQEGDGRVRRIGHTLVVRPFNGPLLRFTDDTYQMQEETGKHCQFSGSLPGRPYWLVDSSWYEGGRLLLVSKKSGRVTRLLDNALISPDHKQLLTFRLAGLEGIIPSIELLDITNTTTKQLWYRELHQWHIERAVWLNNHTIAIVRRPLDSTFLDTVRYSSYIRLSLPN